MLRPDCIWVWIFSTTSPSWMMSCLTLMPVISVNALASTFDSYSCVAMVSETMLISMPAKGFAALMNHCISLHLLVLVSVEGWNSCRSTSWPPPRRRTPERERSPNAVIAMALAIVDRRTRDCHASHGFLHLE